PVRRAGAAAPRPRCGTPTGSCRSPASDPARRGGPRGPPGRSRKRGCACRPLLPRRGRAEGNLSIGYSFLRMRKLRGGVFLLGIALAILGQESPEKKSGWPKSLADGLPKELPGYTPAPTDPLPDTDENEMGVFTQVARFFQRIESPTVTRQFQLVV